MEAVGGMFGCGTHCVAIWTDPQQKANQDLFRYIFDVTTALRRRNFSAVSDPIGGLVVVHVPAGDTFERDVYIRQQLRDIIDSFPNPHQFKLHIPNF